MVGYFVLKETPQKRRVTDERVVQILNETILYVVKCDIIQLHTNYKLGRTGINKKQKSLR